MLKGLQHLNLETLTLREEQMDAIRSPRISDFLILCHQSPLVLMPRLHQLRGPGGSGDKNVIIPHFFVILMNDFTHEFEQGIR